MKKLFVCMVFLAVGLMAPVKPIRAQDPISLIIKEGVKKVIKAVDLKIQRLQTRTIGLQNTQKVLENAMAKARLGEIAHWVEKQRALYAGYFEELRQVKTTVAYYHRIKEIMEQQTALIARYKTASAAIAGDRHYSPAEVAYMKRVYSGILQHSLQNLDLLSLAIKSFATQMSDAARMEMIDRVEQGLQRNYRDLKTFTRQNVQLSLERSKSQSEVALIKALYGVQ